MITKALSIKIFHAQIEYENDKNPFKRNTNTRKNVFDSGCKEFLIYDCVGV